MCTNDNEQDMPSRHIMNVIMRLAYNNEMRK